MFGCVRCRGVMIHVLPSFNRIEHFRISSQNLQLSLFCSRTCFLCHCVPLLSKICSLLLNQPLLLQTSQPQRELNRTRHDETGRQTRRQNQRALSHRPHSVVACFCIAPSVVLSIKYSVRSTQYLVLSAEYSILSTWYLKPGT